MTQFEIINQMISSPYSLLHISSSIGEEEKIKEILDKLTQIKKKQIQQNGQITQSKNGKKVISSSKVVDETPLLYFDDSKLLDHRGNSPLFWACHFGKNETVNLLIKNYHMPINRQNFEGDTPLAVGVKSGSYDVVCTLLDCGANPNIPNVRAETPLHIAACFGYSDICKELIKFGGWIDAEDDCGDTPLHWAVREEQVDIVGILLNLGADPFHENEDNESPFNLAESVGSESIMKVFDSIAGTNSTKDDVDGEAFDFTFMHSNDQYNNRMSKGPEESSNDMEVDLSQSDDSRGTVEIDVNTSGTVHPSSFGKDEEYYQMAGLEEKKLSESKRSEVNRSLKGKGRTMPPIQEQQSLIHT